MTKNDLLFAIRNSGADVKSSMSKAELQGIYDKLHVHSIPEPEKIEKEEPEKIEKEEPEKIEKEEPEKVEKEEPEKIEKEEPEKVEKEEPEKVTAEFDELLGKIKGAEAPEPKAAKEKPLITKEGRKRKKGESSPDSFRVEGYVLLLVTDTVFPFIFSWVNNMLDKHVKVKPYDLQLSEKDWSKLEPLADQAADYMAVQLNPIAGFFIVSAFFYSNNLIMVRMSAEPLKAETKKI
jgi:hypothetical protein